ncbi:thiamine biosynthesis protein ThiF [Mesorhizobium silamurunense]|uniref:thiamine biosynthesis protein ThiF n=1 Tax=Mesorhizobium silamurunense TaxID=499528 RepID=UPI00177E90C4|nr:thiamine biosynthesis protein ThiF [Mesorhizobium silamurunense]
MADNVIGGLNRSAKLYIDRASASTVEEALDRLKSFRMHLFIGEAAASSPTHQAALLTALNCGRRTFLGGVTVSGALHASLTLPVAAGATLADAVVALMGTIVDDIPDGVPLVSIGTPSGIDCGGFAVRTTFDGWRGAVVPLGTAALPETVEFAPSGVLAGALAVAELFAHFDGEAIAGYRPVGMSLWEQSASADWRSAGAGGPPPAKLPSDFWLIGLGHQGQAFLWTIGMLPFADASKVRLFLQDVDEAGGSTESTSVLTFPGAEGQLKTRICANWAERRGFQTRLVERRFARDLRVGNDEPLLALCGVDNPQARSFLEGAGFTTIFEAGLGSGVEDFRLIRTHSFPAPVTAAEVWADGSNIQGVALVERPPAYLDLQKRGHLDECGLTRLAEVAVGAPFVGVTAAAVMVSQIIRMVVDGRRPTVLNIDLRALQHRSLVDQKGTDIVVFRTAESM